MKKKLLICSLSVMLLVVGVLVAQGVTQKQTEGQGSTEILLNNANEISKKNKCNPPLRKKYL